MNIVKTALYTMDNGRSLFKVFIFLYKKALSLEGLTPVFETGIKTPFKRPIADTVQVTGCLVLFEYGHCYSKQYSF